MSNIYTKLLEVQKAAKAIKKDSDNPFFHSKYFDINSLLAEVKPLLNKQGLVLLQPLDGSTLLTKIVDSETEKEISFSVSLPPAPDAQKMGSVITYFRRYALQSLLALEAEDDDGEASVGREPEIQIAGTDTTKARKPYKI